MNSIVAVRRGSCRNLVMVADKGKNKMRNITSEHVKLMGEPLSKFVYASVTEYITKSRGNVECR